jgi:hypothetical protein
MKHRFGTIVFRANEGGAPDVNSTSGFTEALALAAGRELTPEEVASIRDDDRSVAGGLTTESDQGQERDDLGQFAAGEPAAQPDPQPTGGAAPQGEPKGEPQPEPSPLEKQLADSQSFIGRQAETIGECAPA